MVLDPCLAVAAYWVVVLELCSGVVACSAHLPEGQFVLVARTR